METLLVMGKAHTVVLVVEHQRMEAAQIKTVVVAAMAVLARALTKSRTHPTNKTMHLKVLQAVDSIVNHQHLRHSGAAKRQKNPQNQCHPQITRLLTSLHNLFQASSQIVTNQHPTSHPRIRPLLSKAAPQTQLSNHLVGRGANPSGKRRQSLHLRQRISARLKANQVKIMGLTMTNPKSSRITNNLKPLILAIYST